MYHNSRPNWFGCCMQQVTNNTFKLILQGSNVKLSDIHFRNIRGASLSHVAVTLNCSNAFPCQGVELVDIDLSYIGAPSNDGVPVRSTCQNVKPTFTGKMNPAACLAK